MILHVSPCYKSVYSGNYAAWWNDRGSSNLPVSIFLLQTAFLAVVRVCDTRPTANDTTTLHRQCDSGLRQTALARIRRHLIRPVIALIANANEDCRTNVRVANDADTVVFLAEAADGNARLLTAHDKVWMMLRHGATLSLAALRSSAR